MSHISHIITVEQAQSVELDKKAFYSNMLRNHVLITPYTDAIVTCKFKQGIVDSHYWYLRSAYITTFGFCAEPPNKKDLEEILYFLMFSF